MGVTPFQGAVDGAFGVRRVRLVGAVMAAGGVVLLALTSLTWFEGYVCVPGSPCSSTLWGQRGPAYLVAAAAVASLLTGVALARVRAVPRRGFGVAPEAIGAAPLTVVAVVLIVPASGLTTPISRAPAAWAALAVAVVIAGCGWGARLVSPKGLRASDARTHGGVRAAGATVVVGAVLLLASTPLTWFSSGDDGCPGADHLCRTSLWTQHLEWVGLAIVAALALGFALRLLGAHSDSVARHAALAASLSAVALLVLTVAFMFIPPHDLPSPWARATASWLGLGAATIAATGGLSIAAALTRRPPA